MSRPAQVLAAPGNELGEAPLWIPEQEELVWLDIIGLRLHRLRPATGAVRSVRLTAMATALGLTDGAELVSATRTGFGLLDPESGLIVELYGGLVADPGDRMNDGGVAPDGAFWAGSMVGEQRAGSGSLWRWRGEGEPELVLDGVTTSNGLDWFDDDAGALLYVDSASGGIDRLAVGTEGGATLAKRQRIATIQRGVPDGLCLDQDGLAWVAIWGAGEVRAYDREGELQETITVPVHNPSSCAFGGDDLKTLFITSARQGLAEPKPADGCLLACRMSTPGRVTPRFRRPAPRREQD